MKVLIVLFWLCLAYFASVPLLGLKHGIDKQGLETSIITEDDAKACEAQPWVRERKERRERELRERVEQHRAAIAAGRLAIDVPTLPEKLPCQIAKPDTVGYDWFYGVRLADGWYYRTFVAPARRG
jgi:hypothetical protein